MGKRLIVAPHADDEIFWCYSVLKGSTVIVLGGRTEKAKEVSQKIAQDLGYDLYLYDFEDRGFYKYFNEIRNTIEGVVNSVKPEEIYIPSKTHHQDHNTVNDIMQIIARPMRLPYLRRIIEFPYWGLEEYKFNLIKEVQQKKFEHVKLFGELQWERYIEGYNKHIANKFDYSGYYEPFNIKFQFD